MTTTTTTDRPPTARRVGSSRWPILERALADRRRSLIGWGLGIGAYVALIVAFWPSIRGSSEISKAIENYPDAMKEFFGGAAAFDYTRPGGFLNTQLFSLVLPLLITIFAIGYGASALAGDQHADQLDLELALPLRGPASSPRRFSHSPPASRRSRSSRVSSSSPLVRSSISASASSTSQRHARAQGSSRCSTAFSPSPSVPAPEAVASPSEWPPPHLSRATSSKP